jgi:hypothetical protein
MGRWVDTMVRGVDIPWVGGSIYHGLGGQYTMGRGVDILYIGFFSRVANFRYVRGR